MATFQDWDEFDLFNSTNLIINGNFPDDIAGWVFYSDVDIDWDSGRAKLTQDKGYRSAHQDVSVTAGGRYTLSADIINQTVQGRVYALDSNGDNLGSLNESGSLTINPSTNAIKIYMGGKDGAGYCYFDNIKLIPV